MKLQAQSYLGCQPVCKGVLKLHRDNHMVVLEDCKGRHDIVIVPAIQDFLGC
uniref:Uncharacterized protein n=1 Tax=Rhizophora mucronata TaxID=61149 RepID=A0A2P2P3T2_RHIMU